MNLTIVVCLKFKGKSLKEVIHKNLKKHSYATQNLSKPWKKKTNSLNFFSETVFPNTMKQLFVFLVNNYLRIMLNGLQSSVYQGQNSYHLTHGHQFVTFSNKVKLYYKLILQIVIWVIKWWMNYLTEMD